jgi:adenosine deaminase
VLLHEHLDGALRVPTLFDLLRQRGIVSPAADGARAGAVVRRPTPTPAAWSNT